MVLEGSLSDAVFRTLSADAGSVIEAEAPDRTRQRPRFASAPDGYQRAHMGAGEQMTIDTSNALPRPATSAPNGSPRLRARPLD